MGRRGISLTQGTRRRGHSGLAGLRRGGAKTRGCKGLGLRRGRGWSCHRALEPGAVHEDDEPEACAEDALRENMMCHHGVAPLPRVQR